MSDPSNPRRKPTVKDIALAAGVSHPTVSRILNQNLENYPLRPETIDKVRRVASELGYTPNRMARSLKTNRTRLVGLSLLQLPSIPSEPAWTEQLIWSERPAGWTDLIYGVVSAAAARQYETVMLGRLEGPATSLSGEQIFPDYLDGLLYQSPSMQHREYLDLPGRGRPVVLIGHGPAGVDLPQCHIDTRGVIARLVRDVLDRGASRLAFIFRGMPHLTLTAQRLEGFRQGLAEAGAEFDPSLVLIENLPAGEMTRRLAALLAFDQGVDGVIFGEHTGREIVIEAATAAGRGLGEDLHAAGLRSGPPRDPPTAGIACAYIPIADLGWRACNMLIDLIEGLPLNAEQAVAAVKIIEAPPRRRMRATD